ncbi:hypothetical protein BS50DRAFT_138288 [Corynespora cassiicola Philippines]|uniref:Rhodopsin domain-containing protein n=1 Tax=Corynespora cassiicola Philippines TaxID=1448308 RepID=A0A2T2N9L3_CORCC|nr:hypothetical protein BS50DRAFT_138288 [Corynespora cassiicola Philippines]
MVDNRGPELRAVCSVFVGMAFVATALRVYVRLHLVRAFGWDDAFMIMAMLTHIMFATCSISGTFWGTGRHRWDLTDEGFFKAMRYWWLCYLSYCSTMIFAKISIGLFLLRVTVSKIHRLIIFIVMGLTVLTGIVFFFVSLFQCTPISYFWDKNQDGFCVNVDVIIALTFLYSAVSAICDFTFGIQPIFLVWNLNMSRNSKAMLVPILSMACVASTAVLVRMAYVMDFKSPDFLWATVDIAIWSDIEQGLAVTAGSLATLRPLYRLIAQRLNIQTTGMNKDSGKETPDWYRSGSAGNRKRSGPFSLITFTKAEHARKSDEEYGMGNLQPIQLRDDLIPPEREGSNGSDKGFNSWRIQVGEDGSQENLTTTAPTKKKNSVIGGITKQTDVFMESARNSQAHR